MKKLDLTLSCSSILNSCIARVVFMSKNVEGVNLPRAQELLCSSNTFSFVNISVFYQNFAILWRLIARKSVHCPTDFITEEHIVTLTLGS